MFSSHLMEEVFVEESKLRLAVRVASWMRRHPRQLKLLSSFTQPLSVSDVAARSGVVLKKCTDALKLMSKAKLVGCLNPEANWSRIYWLTDLGTAWQEVCNVARRIEQPEYFVPEMDWSVYGQVRTTARSAVVQHLREPMHPFRLKRAIYHRDPRSKLTSHNTARTMRFLYRKQVVERVWLRKRKHPLYQLTQRGRTCRELLQRARRWR